MRLILLLSISLIVSGCSTSGHEGDVYAIDKYGMLPGGDAAIYEPIPRYPVLGGFKLNQGTPTIDALLEAFSTNGAKTFKGRGLKFNYVEVYPGRAWCDMSFRSGLVVYLFGVQFVQGDNGDVVAVVRNMRTAENYPVDYKVLDVNSNVYAALLDAQHLNSISPTQVGPKP